MWSKNGKPVETVTFPDPSTSSVTSIVVSRVARV
jgi:hypothetical protein